MPTPNRGRKSEKRAAKRLGAKWSASSGAGSNKGDYQTDRFCFEHKETKSRSYRVSLSELDKLCREASGQGKEPAFHLEFVDGTERTVSGGSWIAVPEYIFQELLEES